MAHSPGTFKVETRPYGDGFKSMIIVKCRSCPREDMKPGTNAGWGVRMFPGWLLGRHGAGTDVCPDCRAAKARRPDLSPVAKRMIYNKIEDRLAGSTSLTLPVFANRKDGPPDAHPAPPPEPANTVMADKLTEALKMKKQTTPATPVPTEHWPLEYQIAGRKLNRPSRSYGYSSDKSAYAAATKYVRLAGVKAGVQVAEQPDGKWMWWPTTHLPPVLPQAEAPAAPVETKEPEPMPSTDIPAPYTADLGSSTLRQPSRAERQAIALSLDHHYDQPMERYRKDYSDQKIAEKLDVPRKWVTDLRVDLYGDHDRNELSEQQAKKLDEAVALADAAVTRLTEMAVEAENLRETLKVARAKLS